MNLRNTITLPLSPHELFDLLLDVERVIPCIPGATLERVEGDVYRASVKLKVGPVTAGYKGTVRFIEIDREQRTAVMKAAGTETRGQGKADATIHASVAGGEGESTLVMETDLAIRGRVAQFGRGVINDVSESLMSQFAENLKAQMMSGSTTPEASPGADEPNVAAEASSTSQPFAAASEPTAALSIGVLARPLVKRVGPVVLGVLMGLLVARRRR